MRSGCRAARRDVGDRNRRGVGGDEAVSARTASTSASTARLTARSSKTASMTSVRPGKAGEVPGSREERGQPLGTRACVIRRRLSRPSRMLRAALSPFPTRGSSASLSRTSTPAWRDGRPRDAGAHEARADDAEPLAPARGVAVPAATPSSFLSAVVAKKISTSWRETSVTASSPKRRAPRPRPARMPCSIPTRTASSAASGAG